MRKALVVTALAAALAAAALAGPPAQAQGVTFSVSGGLLSITEPSDTTLTGGSIATLAGTAITGSLGTTTVSDQRGVLLGTWTTSIAQTTAFTDGSTTIPAANTTVWVPGVIVPTGVATVTAGLYVAQATGLALTGTGQPFVSATLVTGVNSATFNPSVAVTIPSNATAGSYSGVITQTIG
jgi:hypothetical protein